MKGMKNHREPRSPVVASLLLVAAVVGYRVAVQKPPVAADRYHQRVRESAELMPQRIGSWVGRDVPITPGAVAMLHPNVIISRQYSDLQTGWGMGFILIQCRDARDMLGHYPPVCYVAHGWTAVSAEPKTWQSGDLTLRGTQYEFSRMGLEETGHVVVYDCMVLPDGRTCGDMDTVENAARDYRTRYFGAAQLQVECDAGIPPEKRDELFIMAIGAARPIVNQLGSEVSE